MCEDHPQLPHAYHIVEVRVENPTVRTFVLDGQMEADPGQFVMAWLPGIDEKPFSLSGTDPIAITVARVGPFTTRMHGLAQGDQLWLRGPYGRGFTVCDGPLMVVCGGCGAAPLHHLAQVARQSDRKVHVVLGARTAAGLFFQERYAALGCAVHVATDDGSLGLEGTAIDLVVALLDEISEVSVRAGLPDLEQSYDPPVNGQDLGGLHQPSTLYACGPEPMLDAVRLLAEERGLPCQLSHEAYMRCGFGVCGSCARDGRLVCRDGPVFEG